MYNSCFMKTARYVPILFLGFIFSGAVNAAGLLEVKQTIFGMDCAPCAYGVEKNLKKIQDIKDVSVSLNEGYAEVTLKPGNSVTMDKIRQVIREGGFTPKDATVLVSGTIALVDGQMTLLSNMNQRYKLTRADEMPAAWQQLQALSDGAKVEIKGHVREDSTTGIAVLAIQQISQEG